MPHPVELAQQLVVEGTLTALVSLDVEQATAEVLPKLDAALATDR